MVKNNIELDVKVKCLEGGETQQSLAEKIGTTGQYVNRIIKKKDGPVNKTLVEMMEALGYDIEFVYVKREYSMKGQQEVLAGLLFIVLLVAIVFIIGSYWLIEIGLAVIVLLVSFIAKKIINRKRRK